MEGFDVEKELELAILDYQTAHDEIKMAREVNDPELLREAEEKLKRAKETLKKIIDEISVD